MESKIIKQFYAFIDKARTVVPTMNEPTVLFLYHDQKPDSNVDEATAFAYCDDNSFTQSLGNFLVLNPQFMQATQDALNGAAQILTEQHNQSKKAQDNGNDKS